MNFKKLIPSVLRLQNISPEEVSELLHSSKELNIYDMNGPQRWAEARVPGAKLLDVQADLNAELPAEKDKQLIFYCSNPMCRKAPNAATKAEYLGYTNVQVMRAGITGWMSAGFDTESGTPHT